jgi:CBS domain-containing protein
MSVGKICARDVDTAAIDESVQTVALRMHSRNVGSLVVTNGAGKPIGIVTDRDLAMKVIAQGKSPSDTTVDEVMTHNPRTISEDAPIEKALSMMRNGAFRRIPVVDDDDMLAGLLSLDDILDLFAEEFSEIGALLRREGPRVLIEP